MMHLIFKLASGHGAETKQKTIHPLVARIRSWRPLASPVETWLAQNLYSAPGNRLAIFIIWRAWIRHCETEKINPGTRTELIAAVRTKYPRAKIVLGLSGRDTRPGQRHLTGIALR